MNIRRFSFNDQSTIFDWWNLEGLQKQLGVYQKASDWTQRLLKNEFAYTVEHDNKIIAVFEFLALYQSSSGNIAKAFYFTPYLDANVAIQDEMIKKAQELQDYQITQIQFYQWQPILIELWVPQDKQGVKENEKVKEVNKKGNRHGSNKSKSKAISNAKHGSIGTADNPNQQSIQSIQPEPATV